MRQKIADLVNIIYGFRKFLAWLFLFTIGVVFRLLNYIDGAQFVELMKTTFMGFVAANGVEHLVSVTKSYFDSKGKPVETGDNVVNADDGEGETK